jgi:DNA repair/transcription protein MET18/MMS19
LKHTQREIVVPYLSSFLPLLLQALNLKDSNVRYASALTLLSSIEEIPELISKHLQTLIPQLLKLITFRPKDDDLKFNNPEVRLVSLNCLHALTVNVPVVKLVPYQQEILNKLSPVLDDKKRTVRKGAVDTRQAYFELGRSAMD